MLQVTEKGFQRESKLTMEIASLRGKLRRAGLLNAGPRMPRKTLVRASRQSDDSEDDEGDDNAASQGSPDRPPTIAEEEEEDGREEEGKADAEEEEAPVEDARHAMSGADGSTSGSSGANGEAVGKDERLAVTETPVAGQVDYGVPEVAVQSQRGGGMAISITEVAGAPREGSMLTAGRQVCVSVARLMALPSQARVVVMASHSRTCSCVWQRVSMPRAAIHESCEDTHALAAG